MQGAPSAAEVVARPSNRGAFLVIFAIVAASAVVWVGTGDLLLAIAPVFLVSCVYAMLRAPLEWTGIGLLFLTLVTDDVKANPAEGRWEGPLFPLGRILFENLNNVTGVEALRFGGIDVVLFVLLGVVLARRGLGETTRAEGYVPTPAPLRTWALLMLACVVVLWAWGLLHGGDFKSSLWQTRTLLWCGPICFLFFKTLRGPRDHGALAVAIVVAALVKFAIGLYFYEIVCRPLNHRPTYVNTHNDTVLYAVAVMLVGANALYNRGARSIVVAACCLPPLAMAIFINNRRLAFVSVAACLVVLYLLLPRGRLKKRILAVAGAGVPLLAAYVAIGRSATYGIFGPAAKIWSLMSGEDRSMGTRDIENYNLINTLKPFPTPIIGQGFGHEYNEISKADSIKEFFSLYKYIAHNSVLWQWTLGGLVGFTVMWMLFALGVFFAARAFNAATRPTDRVAAITCLAVIVAHEIQEWGDMGSQNWLGVFLFGAAMAVAGKLAVSVGAWER